MQGLSLRPPDLPVPLTPIPAHLPMQISIHTSGDLPASGTCCSVGLELHGSQNVAGPIVLENDGTCFGQGSVDTFRVEATDVGDLQQLHVRLEAPVSASLTSLRTLTRLLAVTTGNFSEKGLYR